MDKPNSICCEYCGKIFTPDDEKDIYCSEVCLNEANGEDEEE